MPRLPLKGAPWLLLIQAALAARERWGVLEPHERQELAALLRATRGRPGNLTAREKAQLRRLVGRLDLPGLGTELFTGSRRRRRRR